MLTGRVARNGRHQKAPARGADGPAPERVVLKRELRDLLGGVWDALDVPGFAWLASVLGWPNSLLPERFSEYRLLYSLDIPRTLRYLADISIPSVARAAPEWVPAPLSPFVFHPSRVEAHRDHNRSWTSHSREAWLFVNGILTDADVAQLNATYLADLFHRPITVVQNATDGLLDDLSECVSEKAFDRTGEAATVAFPAIYDAITDAEKQRVVVIAHSQGTLIAAVVLRLMKLIYRPDGHAGARASVPDSVRQAVRDAGIGLDIGDFDPLSLGDLAKLELYCFANCATHMRYVDAAARQPRIESFGNEHDIVARLGMLAPNPVRWGIEIDGPRYLAPGAWGHLLNRHYLRAIDRTQRRGHKRGPAQSGPAPYVLLDPDAWPEPHQPHLYRYLNGGHPVPASAPSTPGANGATRTR